MRRAHRLVLGGAALAGAVALILAAPRLLPALPGFEVRRVEIVGTRLLPAGEVLRTSGIRGGQSVWDEPAAWERALERHPVVEWARVTRRLPGTLRVEVREKQPVAYLAGGILTPVTASGEPLPVDPTHAVADLPIVRPVEEGKAPLWVLEETERLSRMDPGLLAEVSEIVARDAEQRVLLLRHRKADILIAAGAPADRLVELRAVLADVGTRSGMEETDAVARVDLRFADQVVVRLPFSVQTP